MSKSDIVVLTLPLSKETYHLIDENRFTVMKKGSVLVNIARGSIVDEKALLKALEQKLLGAVLDVFEEEPLSSDNPFWGKENVIITPHNSFVGVVGEGYLRGSVLSTRGPGWTHLRCTGCSARSIAG